MPRPTGILPEAVVESKVRGNATLMKMKNVSANTDINAGEPRTFAGFTFVAQKVIYCQEASGQYHAGNMMTQFGDVAIIECDLEEAAANNYASFDTVDYDPVNNRVVPNGTGGAIPIGRAAPKGCLGDDITDAASLPDWSNPNSAAAAGDSKILVILTKQ